MTPREQARAAGLNKYLGDGPCKRGHTNVHRYVSTGCCIRCSHLRGKAYDKTPAGRETLRKYRQSPKGKARLRATRLKYVYGLTIEGYSALLRTQGGCCAICKVKLVEGIGSARADALCIDHCHSEKNVRGLLCSHCNRGLGMFRDNSDFLRAAATYVRLGQ